ncbi:MAG TPA: DUF4129 domain-containing protein [Anaerolineales bacterium]|nr:DUF4129 domain-containing protein [Anaerolineales bacterium]
MRFLLAVWLIALLSLTPSNISAASLPSYRLQGGTPIPFEEYWQLVRDTRDAILQLESKSEAVVRQELNALAAQWDQVGAVELPDHSVIHVESSYLSGELRADAPGLERLANLLDALLHAHAEYPQNLFTLEDVVPLKDILARPEFQWEESQPIVMPNWLDRIFTWLEQVTNRLVNATLPYGRIPLIVTAVIVFLLSLFFISRSLSRSLVREAQLEAEASESDGLLTSKGAFKRAENLSMQGDYRNAIRYLYLSSLLVLDEQGVMRYDRSRTNREYLRSVSSRPELAKPLRDVIEVFDRVWYGYEAVDENTYKSYVEHVEELREKKE